MAFCILYLLSNISGYKMYYKSLPLMSNIYEIHKNVKKCIIEKGTEQHMYFKLCYNKYIEFCSNKCSVGNEEGNRLLIITYTNDKPYRTGIQNCYILRKNNTSKQKMCIIRGNGR